MELNRVIFELHGMIHSRLFGPDSWLAAGEVCDALGKKLQLLGLEERVSENTTRATQRGKQLDLTLIGVFPRHPWRVRSPRGPGDAWAHPQLRS